MSPEGAMAQETQQPNAAQSMSEGLNALQGGTDALLQGLTDAGAPAEAIALAQTASDALAQLTAMIGGEEQSEQPAAAEMTNA